jgi:hypothetical protein
LTRLNVSAKRPLSLIVVVGKVKEVMKDYPIIVGELSIHEGSIHKKITLEVRSPVENEVEGSRTPPARG